MRRLAPLLLLATLVGGCYIVPVDPPPLRGRAPVEWRALVGCYRIDGWRFALDSVPAAPRYYHVDEVARQARAGPQDGSERPEQLWWITDWNSVELMIYNGLWGDRFELVVRGDSLVGRHYSITHRGGSGPQRVVAVREPCPAAGG